MTLRLAIKSIETYREKDGLYETRWIPVSAIVDNLPFNKIMEEHPKLNIIYEGTFNDGKLLNYTIKGPKKLCNEFMISLMSIKEFTKYFDIMTVGKYNYYWKKG